MENRDGQDRSMNWWRRAFGCIAVYLSIWTKEWTIRRLAKRGGDRRHERVSDKLNRKADFFNSGVKGQDQSFDSCLFVATWEMELFSSEFSENKRKEEMMMNKGRDDRGFIIMPRAIFNVAESKER